MSDAVKECVRIAFEELGLHRIEANIMPHNIASLCKTAGEAVGGEGLGLQVSKNQLVSGRTTPHGELNED